MMYEAIMKKVAKDNNLPTALVAKTYHAYWKAIREYIASRPLKEFLTDDEFQEARPNINIPSIGKFSVSLDRYRRIRKSYLNNNKNVTHKENKTTA